jgi:hypothetical protein
MGCTCTRTLRARGGGGGYNNDYLIKLETSHVGSDRSVM